MHVGAFVGATIITLHTGRGARGAMEALCKCLCCCMWACMMIVQCTNVLFVLVVYLQAKRPNGNRGPGRCDGGKEVNITCETMYLQL